MENNETEDLELPPEEAPAEAEKPPPDPGLFDELWESGTTAAHGGKEPATALEIAEFDVSSGLCGKHIKAAGKDFVLQIRSLTPKQEMSCTKNVEGPIELATKFSEMSLCAMNGRPLKPHEKEWLWRHLGTGGRQLVTGMYGVSFMTDPKAVKEAKESLK